MDVGSKTVRLRITSDDPINDTLYVELLGSGIEGQQPPTLFFLGQNYPNPFSLYTEMDYGIAGEADWVRLTIYDARGALVRTLVNRFSNPDNYIVKWDGRSSAGERVASGIYFYQLQHAGKTLTRKMVMLR